MREQGTLERLTLATIVAIIGLCLSGPQSAWAQKIFGRKPAALTPEKADDPIVQLLTFTDKHHLLKVQLRTLEWPAQAEKPKATLTGDSTDPVVLRRVERALWHPLARAFQKHYHTAGLDHAYAELRLVFNDTECFIGLHEAGFTLNNYEWNTDDLFYSWTLSRVVDEIYEHNTGEHLSTEQLEGLSGEYSLRGEKEAFAAEEAKRRAELDQLPK